MLYYFNTSNVTIQLNSFYLARLKFCISIHLMLLFNSTKLINNFGKYGISIHLMLLFNAYTIPLFLIKYNFNTSNVTIQPHFLLFLLYLLHHFNTSNVTIQLSCQNSEMACRLNFNTSNVTIQLYVVTTYSYSFLISIHLMLLFNISDKPISDKAVAFQYI